MKTCNRCGVSKNETEFYAQNGRCKQCAKHAARENRAANLERVRAYDRERGRTLARRERAAAYAQTDAGRRATRNARRAWEDRNSAKRRAHFAAGNAIRDRFLTRKPCEICGTTERVQAHHDDYSKPLEVRWLCVTHHAEHHRRQREMDRGA